MQPSFTINMHADETRPLEAEVKKVGQTTWFNLRSGEYPNEAAVTVFCTPRQMLEMARQIEAQVTPHLYSEVTVEEAIERG